MKLHLKNPPAKSGGKFSIDSFWQVWADASNFTNSGPGFLMGRSNAIATTISSWISRKQSDQWQAVDYVELAKAFYMETLPEASIMEGSLRDCSHRTYPTPRSGTSAGACLRQTLLAISAMKRMKKFAQILSSPHVAASAGPGARPSGVEWPPWRGGQVAGDSRQKFFGLNLFQKVASSCTSCTFFVAWAEDVLNDNACSTLKFPKLSAPSTQPFVPHLPRRIWRSYLPKISLALSNSCMITTNTKSVTTWCVDSYLIGAARFRLGILLLFLNFHLLQKMCQMFFLVLLKARKKISSETFRNGNFSEDSLWSWL